MAASAAPATRQPGFAMTCEPDAPNPRVRIVLQGDVNGDRLVDAFIQLYAQQPEAAGYDRLFDLTGYESGFEVTHLKRLQAAYRRLGVDPARPCRSAFVTQDANFRLWAASMGHQFEGREFRAFRTLEEAERFLAEPPLQRRPITAAS